MQELTTENTKGTKSHKADRWLLAFGFRLSALGSRLSDILMRMRKWTVLALVASVVLAVGCTSAVHPAVRDGHNGGPTTDTGVLAQGTNTTGGDAAGSLNLKHSQPKHEGGESAGH